MTDPTEDAAPERALHRVLGEIRRRGGGIGRGPIEDAISHARQYVAALPDQPAGTTPLLIDLGSGGGLPGLVLAVDAPAWRVVLVDRRAKRADLLRYGARALGVDDRVHVRCADASGLEDDPELRGAADVVSARSFGPPLQVLALAAPLLRSNGVILVSDPPDGSARWTEADLASLHLVDDGRIGGIRRFVPRA